MSTDRDRKAQEREKLKNIINQWNVNRLDIFWLSEPNEDLEFHGAMRFYFQDAGQKVATKCIRVSSTATTSDVIETLIEKFRPDIRMLSIPEYALYEIHENGEERKLRADEMPLWVQLDWHKDDREGRFLLRRMDEKSYISSMDACDTNFKRKLSKREKKDKKKKEKREKLKAAEESKKDGIAERLYSELPETSFTRSISNPEAVMRRRRQQILERKLQQFCEEGGTDAGGTLRIFGESLNKDVPYKTLLLSTKDSASFVVKEILDKYGYDKEDPALYCLVQVIVASHAQNEVPDFQNSGGIREYILDDDDCPLTILRQHNRNRGTLNFHVRRRPADYQPRKRKKKPKPTKGEEANYNDSTAEKLPYLLELNPDGTELHGPSKKHRLYLNVTEVGSERSSSTGGQYLQLFGPNVQPRHCVIAHTERIVTVTPCSRDAETYVNNMRIYETTILQNGMVVRFGKLHTFRFVDPLHDQKHGMLPDPRQHPEFIERSRREDQISLHHHGSYETTFDADGNVETVSTHSRDDRLSKKSDDALSHRSLGRESTHGRSSYERFEQKRGNDPILPAVLEFWEEGEDAFLAAAITNLDPSQVQFNLSPTYALYMAARYRASTHFRPDTTPNDRAHRLTALMNNVATVMHQVIQDRYRDALALAFWLANTSELLHFLKQDRHLSAYTLDAQDLLAESVQLAFRSLVQCIQVELQDAMPAFLEERDDPNEEEVADVLGVLGSAMSILRRCRVNAALTIQMFSLVFHFINMWLFNKVVCETRPNLCTRQWGIRLKRRLSRVLSWSEKQGLELAADCHLSRIVQAAHLLQAPKSSSEDLDSISTLCFKLNSLQLQTLLERYQPAEDEPHVPREFIESVVKLFESTADEHARSEGREIKLEEDSDLQLPFLLPADGYSCDIVRGVPAGLQEFIQPLVQAGLCRLTIQPTSSGYWTIYMSDQDIGRMPSGARSPSVHSHGDDATNNWKQGEPEIVTIRLQKSNNGIGLSIVAAGGADQDKLGIYVKSVVKGGAADLDGRLQAGDQLLKVDGHSLVGVNQEKAAELMTRTGPVVTLEVAKQGAIFNGLSDLLSKPSPIIQRGPRRLSERDIPRLMNEHVPDNRVPTSAGHLMPPRMQSSKSVPSLNSNHEAEPVRVQANGNMRPHDVYNPGYSRTSSTASIPKATEYPDPNSRSKSTNNLRQDAPDPRMHYGNGPEDPNPPPYPGPPDNSMGNRPVPHPGMHQPHMNMHHPPQLPPHSAATIQEERHYQNISMYQQPQPPQQHPPQQQNPYTMHNRGPPQPHPQQPPRSLHSSQSSLNRPDPQGLQSPVDRARPLSTLVSPREQEQYANSMGYVHSNSGPPRSPKGSTHSSMDSHHGSQGYPPRPLHDQRDFRSADQLRPVENEQRVYPDSMSHPDLNSRAYSMHSQEYNMMHMDPRQRDLLRQEAKMEEMREEVRRREDRERLILQQQQHTMGRGGSWSLPRGPNPPVRPPSYHHGPPQAGHTGHPHPPYSGAPPPPAPKPRPQFYNTGNERFQKPPSYPSPHEANSYHDGMHGGHVPPQVGPKMNHQPPPVVSYRYGPSGYPPRSEDANEQQKMNRPMTSDPRMSQPHGKPSPVTPNSRITFELPQGTGGPDKKETSNLMSPSPWEREEKEKLHKQRLEEARRARDEEIRELESRPHLTPQQEERLRALRLEQEFQRRAEELRGEEEDDDDEDLLDRAENRERKLKMQEDLERARQRRLEWEMQQTQNQVKVHPQMTHNEEWKRQQQSLEDEFKAPNSVPHQIPNRPTQPPNSHQLGVNNQQPNLNHHQQMIPNYPPDKNRVENSNQDVPPPLPTSPPPIEPSYQSVYSQKPASMRNPRVNDSYPNHQNSEKMLEPPAPPTRKSSYEITNQMSTLTSSNRYVTSSMRNYDNGAQHYPKKVSFHDPSIEVVDCDANGNLDMDSGNSESYTLDDINEVLATPQNSQNLNTYNTGNTPGVIGTQEVYRDPRQRIEAERNHQERGLTKNPGPEKLTFKEKMKMFAQEVGEQETPKDKVKISRAQRDIETNLNGS